MHENNKIKMVDKHIKMLFSLKIFNYARYVIIMLIHIKSNGLKKKVKG